MIGSIGSSTGISSLRNYSALSGSAGARPGTGAPNMGVPKITLRTQEGDTVTITGKNSASPTYGGSGLGGSLASLNLESNDAFEVNISGELSDQEREDIQATLEKMDSAMSALRSGDFRGGFESMQSALAGGGTVASVSGPPSGGPPMGGPPSEGMAAMGTNSESSAVDTLLQLLESDDDEDSTSTQSVFGDLESKKSTATGTGSNSLAASLRTAAGNASETSLDDFLQQVRDQLRASSTSDGGGERMSPALA